MSKRELITLLLWLLLSAVVALQSMRFGLGSFHTPGPGFLTFGVSLVIGLLVVILFLNAAGKKLNRDVPPLFRGKKIKSVIYGFSLLIAYPLLLDKLGFFLCTFLFMMGCLKLIERKRWSTAISASVSVALVAYFVFDVWLLVQFPKGKWLHNLVSLGGSFWN